MRTLAIETSCDDTSVAIVALHDAIFVVEHILAYTQTKEHKQWGGVVPELAARSHAEKILVILEELKIDWQTIETISVTSHPGLPGALVVGVATAYTLGALHDKPVIEVNHIMGHVFSVLVDRKTSDIQFPYVCLTVSGGHNDLYLVTHEKLNVKNEELSVMANEKLGYTKHNHLAIGASLQVGSYFVTKLGQTIDDAAGECFDKVARMLGGPYPGGKWMDDQAAAFTGKVLDFLFHAAKLQDQPYNFSFSGIKGQIHQQIERGVLDISTPEKVSAVAFQFQEEMTSVLEEKLQKATQSFGAKTVGVVGGVSANQRLREKISENLLLSELNLLFPTKFVYCTDNAAMIGVVGLIMNCTGKN